MDNRGGGGWQRRALEERRVHIREDKSTLGKHLEKLCEMVAFERIGNIKAAKDWKEW